MLIAAVVLSALIHLVAGGLWPQWSYAIDRAMQRLPQQHAREAEVATSDVVYLERRTIPRPAQRNRAHPQPKRVAGLLAPVQPRRVAAGRPHAMRPAKAAPAVTPTTQPELVHHTHHATRERFVAAAPAPHAVPTAALPAGAAAAPVRPGALSAEQLAQLNAKFAQTIAASRTDLATIQKQSEERPVAQRRYPLQFAGLQATLERGEGYIEPITPAQRIGGSVWYYTHYTYMWPDGHLEDDDIPWPFRYPVGHDLFALHIHRIPLQLPPPGYRLTRPLKPFLARFVASAGQG
jgi:hypothetical protein